MDRINNKLIKKVGLGDWLSRKGCLLNKLEDMSSNPQKSGMDDYDYSPISVGSGDQSSLVLLAASIAPDLVR